MTLVRREISLRQLLALIYFLILLLLVVLLVQERRQDEPPFALSHSVAVDAPGVPLLSIYGENFHSSVRGVLAKSLVNEKALLWRQIADLTARGVDVNNGLALVACNGNKIVSLGLKEGERPQLLGSLEMPGAVFLIKIIGDQALVGMRRHAGFSLIDLKDPENLKLVAHYPDSGLVTSMAVDRSTVYYTDMYQGVGRIDFSATNPTPEKLVLLKSPWRITLQGSRLVVGTQSGSVHLFNISQDGALVEVGTLDYSQNVRGVALTEETLAVGFADGTLHVFNLATWPKLNTPARLMLPGRPFHLERIPGQPGIAVSLVASGVALIDVSQPATPTLSGHLKLPKTFQSMKLHSGKVFAAAQKGLEIFSLDEITGGESSRFATEAMIDQDFYKLQSWNGHIYGYRNKGLVELEPKPTAEIPPVNWFVSVIDEDGVSLFEKSENGQVRRVGSLLLKEGAQDAKFRDNHLYVVYQDGLRILAGTRPDNLSTISDLKLPGQPGNFEILDSGYLLVVTRLNGILMVDVRDPQRPLQVASLVPPQHLQPFSVAQDVLVDGRRAYISYAAGGVHVVDVSNPHQPELLQIIDTPGYAKSMVLYDDLLLIADDIAGIFMVDTRDSRGALPIGSLSTPLRVVEIAVADDGLIISSHPGGTMKLPLPQRLQNLHLVNDNELSVEVKKIEKGQYVYLYDEHTSGQVKIMNQ